MQRGLRGIRTAELRWISTTIVGERFYIYASKPGTEARSLVAGPCSAGGAAPAWMIELAAQLKLIEPGTILPTGVIVGSAVIDGVEEVGRSALRVALD